MRRWTLITIIVLFALLVVAAIYQVELAHHGPRRFCGPGVASCTRRSPLLTPTP